MNIHIGSFELELTTTSIFIGINLSRRWRYQTFLTRTSRLLNASDWIDREAPGKTTPIAGGHA